MSSRGAAPRDSMKTPMNEDLVTSFQSLRGALASPAVKKARNLTYRSEGGDMERDAKLKIDMDKAAGKQLKRDKLPAKFLFNVEMAVRVAFGVLIASAIQTRATYDPKDEHAKRWVLFPDWYYFGGLSYCAVAVIFSAKDNAGATIREMCQAFMGVGTALVYNMILFSVYSPSKSESATNPSDDGFFKITRTFSSGPYWVNPSSFFTILPFIMLFTVAMLLLPLEANTRKFAMGNNLFFGT